MAKEKERKEKLVVEVVAAHNLMPKDGQGSSSPFVEVEFDHRKLRTTSKPKTLNPIWNENLIFPISEPSDFPYRHLDVSIHNDRSASAAGRNFLGRVRLPTANVGNEPVAQLFPLEKRSLFSHIRGEITLKIYRAPEDATVVVLPTSGGSAASMAEKKKKGSSSQFITVDTSVQPAPSKPSSIVTAELPVRPEPNPVGIIRPSPVVLATPDPYPVFAPRSITNQDFSLKETKPRLGGVKNRDKSSSTYDLVEQVQYLYVRVVRARDMPVSAESIAEVKLGNYRGFTSPSGSHHWDRVFAFAKETVQSSFLEVFIRTKESGQDYAGRLAFDLGEVPRRVPPDSTLAPQWHLLQDKKGEKGKKGEVMVSVWFGNQADEAFSEAWHSKSAGVHEDLLGSTKSKVYVAPALWYLRVSILEGQDIVPNSMIGRFPDLFARAQLGNQMFRTRSAPVHQTRTMSNPVWGEDLMFVAAEPFDDMLVVTVEDRVAPNRDELLGRFVIPVSTIERRMNDKPVTSRWFGLDRGQGQGQGQFMSRIHMRLCLDGGYHVLDEAMVYSSDLHPPMKQLWNPLVGMLELGVLGATALVPTKVLEGKGGTIDPYCVAKYGQKWIRTRTVIDSVCPKWNEQYTWEVFDPCTVLTIGVFDNSHLNGGIRDTRIGKVRIRLSTLEADRVYTHAYPLVMLHPTGVKKMGELHLAIRFSCVNAGNMLHSYIRPLLPKMHYVDPLLVRQLENLRFQATNVVAARLARAEPPLGREVVEYMLDHGSHLWSMRRSKANFFRLVTVLSAPMAVVRWMESVRSWQRPVHSFLFVTCFILFVSATELILPAALLTLALVGLWNYRLRPRDPPHMDTKLSHADAVYADELDEEFDSFPTSRGTEMLRVRYDRLRSVAGRVQTVVGDIAMQAERFQALLSWRDPRATFLFLMFCLLAAVVMYAVPLRALFGVWGIYALRPPRFRTRMPSHVLSFFRRLPTRADGLL